MKLCKNTPHTCTYLFSFLPRQSHATIGSYRALMHKTFIVSITLSINQCFIIQNWQCYMLLHLILFIHGLTTLTNKGI